MICVDPLVNNGWIVRGKRTKNCHLFIDNGSVEELQEFARRIGLKDEWFQDKSYLPHYDLTSSKRAMAVKEGAREVSRQETVEIMRSIRSADQSTTEPKEGQQQ
jgi:hypothetical protein